MMCDCRLPAWKIKQLKKFHQKLKQQGIEQQVFNHFHHELDARGFGSNSGLIVESTFVEVLRQHNTREENEQIKRGAVPERFAQNANADSHNVL